MGPGCCGGWPSAEWAVGPVCRRRRIAEEMSVIGVAALRAWGKSLCPHGTCWRQGMLALAVRRWISDWGSDWSMWPLQQCCPCLPVALMSAAGEIIVSSLPAWSSPPPIPGGLPYSPSQQSYLCFRCILCYSSLIRGVVELLGVDEDSAGSL